MQPQTQKQPQMQQQLQMQQQYFIHNSGVPVITQKQPEMNSNKLKPSALSQMKGLSITQIVMGGLCIIFGIILIGLDNSYYEPTDGFAYISYGIWSGLYFVLVGGIGLRTVKFNTRCWIVSAMILNIICSAIFFLPLLILSAVGLSFVSGFNRWGSYFGSYHGPSSIEQASLAFNSLLLLISIAELVITIWSTVLCWGAISGWYYFSPCAPVVQNHTAPRVQTRQQFVMYSGVPATTAYAVGTPGYQISVQNQNPAYPVTVHQQLQGPPSYYTANQTASLQNSGYEQAPPPTAYPNDPQHPNKQQR